MLPSKKAISTTIAIAIIIVIVIAGVVGAYYLTSPRVKAISGTVTIWHSLFDTELAAWKARVIAFNADFPNITVKLVSKANMHDALKVGIPAGVGPDLYTWGAQDWEGEFVAANLLAPIDDYVDAATRAVYFPSALSALEYKGKLYGLPLAAEAIALFYNKAMVTTPPADTDQLIAMLKNPPGGAQYALAHVAKSDPYHMYPWVSGFGGYYYNDTSGLVGLNTTGTINAATWFKANILPYLAQDLGGDSQRALFYEKKAAMLISGPWSVAAVKAANISFGLAPIPTIKPSNAVPEPYAGIKGLWWTKNVKSENAEAVAAFLKWWTGVDNQIALGKILGWVPVTFGAYDDPEINNDPVISGFGEQIKNTVPIPSSPQMSEVWGPAGNAWDAVLTNAKTPAQAFQDAQNTVVTNIKTKYGQYP